MELKKCARVDLPHSLDARGAEVVEEDLVIHLVEDQVARQPHPERKERPTG